MQIFGPLLANLLIFLYFLAIFVTIWAFFAHITFIHLFSTVCIIFFISFWGHGSSAPTPSPNDAPVIDEVCDLPCLRKFEYILVFMVIA